MSTKEEKTTGGMITLAFLAFGALGWYGMNWSWFSRTKLTQYSLFCAGEMKAGQCSQEWLRVPPTTYLINAQQQIVVRQSEGQDPKRLAKCAVVDKNNWRCHEGDRAGDLITGFTNGQYWSGFEPSEGAPVSKYPNAGLRSVWRLQWYFEGRDPRENPKARF